MTRALVIGGRRGIGAAVVRALAARGMAVTYTYRTRRGGRLRPRAG
jgi:NAD(P)-dependent dehydrogenase (short-subunit alcohol dehydrogenase family)